MHTRRGAEGAPDAPGSVLLGPRLTKPPRSTRVSSAAISSADAEPTRALMRLSSVKGVCAPNLQEHGEQRARQPQHIATRRAPLHGSLPSGLG